MASKGSLWETEELNRSHILPKNISRVIVEREKESERQCSSLLQTSLEES